MRGARTTKVAIATWTAMLFAVSMGDAFAAGGQGSSADPVSGWLIGVLLSILILMLRRRFPSRPGHESLQRDRIWFDR